MAKEIRFGQEAKDSLVKGIEQLYKAVATTLGPKGRNVAIDREWSAPNVVHDGVTVAKEIDLKDPFENMGAQLVKEAASKTNDVAGDGTTTSTILAYHLILEGLKSSENPMVLRKKILAESREILKRIKDKAIPLKKGDIERVATVSAQDEQIGKLVAEAIQKVGETGVITTEEGRGIETAIEYKEGMEFDKGYASAYFVTNTEKMEAEIEDPLIIITDKRLTSISDIKFLGELIKDNKDIVLIADEIDGEALATLVLNKLKGVFNCLAIKAPGFGDRKKEMLEDIAILTGGTVISENAGRSLESIALEDCGRADKVWADKDNARIIGGKGGKEALDKRIVQLKDQIKKTTSDFDREKYEERLAKLTGGVAVISVGAPTEIEVREKVERVKDAIAATKAAIAEGILPGGATTLIKLSEDMELMKNALQQPFRILMENSGIELVGTTFEFGEGIDVMTGKKTNMIEAGIIEPAKVVRSAVENATSVAIMVLTTEVLITSTKEEKTK